MYVSRSVLLGQVHIFRLIPFVQIDIFNVPLCGVFFKSCLTPLNRNISGLEKNARTRLRTVYFPVL